MPGGVGGGNREVSPYPDYFNPTDPMRKTHFTGRAREHRNRATVKIMDRLARGMITVGGIGTIISVSLVCVFLVWVVIPLFLPPSISDPGRAEIQHPLETPIHLAVDEFRKMAWAIQSDGTLKVVRLDTGKVLVNRNLFKSRKMSAWSLQIRSDEVAFGFEDGTVTLGKIGFRTRFLGPEDTPAEFKRLEEEEVREYKGGLVTRTPEGQLRLQVVVADLEKTIPLAQASPVILIDQAITNSGSVYCSLTADGRLRINAVEERMNLLEDRMEVDLTSGEYDLGKKEPVLPDHLLISGLGDNVFVAWKDGRLIRLETRDPESPRIAETLDLVKEDGVALTALTFLLGRTTLITGDSRGRTRAWFRTKPEGVNTPDGTVLVPTHDFPGGSAPVAAITSSSRTRLFAVAYTDGKVDLMHVTAGNRLAQSSTPGNKAVLDIALAPREDMIVCLVDDGLCRWDVDVKHPEASLAALFTPVWYEGYEKPEHVWQSSSGTDDSEPKLGLMPLIFGTLKATLYSLLFGVPIALLAAVYTSEFMNVRIKSIVKPTIELMASLPSVVLGFLAGLVFAPFVEGVIPAILTGFMTLLLAVLLGAYLWQLLPHSLTLRLSGHRFTVICMVLPLGILGGVILGPVLEKILFAGDIKGWLNGQHGGGVGGWFLLLVPVCALITAVLMGLQVNPWFRRASAEMARRKSAVLDIARFLVGTLFALALALVGALVLDGVGFDPRGGVLGTYVQRNALVVGFVMGFAIIPIIYMYYPRTYVRKIAFEHAQKN